MASIFKHGDRGKYVIEYRDHSGKVRRKSSGTTDRRAALLIAGKLETDAALRRKGVIDPYQDQFQSQNEKPLEQHIADFEAHLLHADRSPKHVASVIKHLQDLSSLNVDRLSDLSQDVVQNLLQALKESGLSARTINWQRQSISAFLSWAVRRNRLRHNPLLSIPRQNERKDVRRKRRALTPEELSRLFDVVSVHGRRPFYAAAYFAGLRRSEIGKLAWGDLDFDSKTLTVRDGKAKGRVDVIPLHDALAADLLSMRPTSCHPSARVFATIPTNRRRKADFLRAGISTEDEAGRVADLHSLRVTLATDLARAGVPVQVAKAMMRHSTVDLTLRVYTKLQTIDLAKGLASIPTPVSTTAAEAEQRTGTDDQSIARSGSQWIGQCPAHETAQRGARPSDGRLLIAASGSVSKVAAANTLSDTARQHAALRVGGSGRNRTCDLPIMSRLLLPIELRIHRLPW